MCVLESFFRAVRCVNLKSFSLGCGFLGIVIVGGCGSKWGEKTRLLTEKCKRQKATTGLGYICAPTDPNATVDNKTTWERLVDHRGVVRSSSSQNQTHEAPASLVFPLHSPLYRASRVNVPTFQPNVAGRALRQRVG